MDFKSKIIELVKTNPNNYELGNKVRNLIWPEVLKELKANKIDKNQISIFDEIKERENARSK
jgi:hypothetical protein